MLLECSGGWGEAQQGPGVGVDSGWGRVLSFLKAGEELGLLTGLKGEAVGPDLNHPVRTCQEASGSSV